MAVFDGATLGIGSISDASLRIMFKQVIKLELKEQVSKRAVEQTAWVTEQAVKVSEKTVVKEGQVVGKTENKERSDSKYMIYSTSSASYSEITYQTYKTDLLA